MVPRKSELWRERLQIRCPIRLPRYSTRTRSPAGLRREHRTKAGVWGVIRVLEGRVRYRTLDQASEMILDPNRPGLVLPDVPHLVEPLGAMQMQIEFYNQPTSEAG